MRTNKLVFKQQIHSGAINAVKVNDLGQSNSKFGQFFYVLKLLLEVLIKP